MASAPCPAARAARRRARCGAAQGTGVAKSLAYSQLVSQICSCSSRSPALLPRSSARQFRGYHTSAWSAQEQQGQEGGTEMGVDPSIRYMPSEAPGVSEGDYQTGRGALWDGGVAEGRNRCSLGWDVGELLLASWCNFARNPINGVLNASHALPHTGAGDW